MSICEDTVEIVKFGFELDATTINVDDLVIRERRDIAKHLKKGKLCRLRDEWIFFDTEKKELYSIDIDNWNKDKIDQDLLGINIVDLWCKDFNRQAYILHQTKGKEANIETQILVFRSGMQNDIYSRIRTRLTGIPNTTVGFTAYKVGIDVVFKLEQKDNSVEYRRFLNE
jgi:hypothetical protein